VDLGADGASFRAGAREGLRAVISWLTRKRSSDPVQLGLALVVSEPQPEAPLTRMRGEPGTRRRLPVPPVEQCTADSAPTRLSRDPATFLAVLHTLGLRGVSAVRFTRNRRTMVSLTGGVLRVHEAFTDAPREVLSAIAIFATTRTKAKRLMARDVIVAFPVPMRPPTRRPAAQHADDEPLAAQLTMLHDQLNRRHFGCTLTALEIQVSRRLARRLGHYTPRSHTGGPGEIVISRRHLRRDGWPEATHTLLHEMVHQWQDETGRPVDHGAGFRGKCRDVGIEPAATRMITR